MSIKFCFYIALFLLFGTVPLQAALNVAVIAPRAGALKVFGDELVDGVRIAVDEINNNGGLGGEKVNLLVVDDQCDDRFAVSTAQMMAVNSSPADKVNAVIGPYCENAFKQAAEIYAKAGIFQIIPQTVSRKNADVFYGGLLKMSGVRERQIDDFYSFYAAHYDDKIVAVVYDGRDDNSMDLAAETLDKFRQQGRSASVKDFNFATYNKDYARMAGDIIRSDARVALIFGQSKEIIRLAENLKETNKNFVVFVNRYQTDGAYAAELGRDAEGSYQIALPSLKDNPAFTETLVKLRILGQEPEGLGVYGYSAVRLWEDLVKKSEALTYEGWSKTAAEESFEAPWGMLRFERGNPENSVNYGIYRFQNGEYTQVY